MRHPNVSEWADFARGILPAPQAGELRSHARHCVSCRRALAALSAVSALGRVEADYTPPESVLQLARAAFGPAVRAPKSRAWERLTSVLVFDSWQAPALAGVRSAGLEERHVTYRSGDWEVDVRFERPGGRALSVTGQVAHLKDGDVRLDGTPVNVRAGKRTVATTALNVFGEFQLDCDPRADDLHLVIAIAAARTQLNIPLPATQRPPTVKATASRKRS